MRGSNPFKVGDLVAWDEKSLLITDTFNSLIDEAGISSGLVVVKVNGYLVDVRGPKGISDGWNHSRFKPDVAGVIKKILKEKL